MKYVHCFHKDMIGKGLGQARAVAVCRHLDCKHISDDDMCTFMSAEERRVLTAAKIKLAKKAEPEKPAENDDTDTE